MLAFNAISPFEQSLNDLPQKRFASMAMKSGIALPWLQRVGKETRWGPRPMTHWQNFILEHHMMQQQDTLHDGFAWRYLLDGSQLDSPNEQKPTVVTVIEGGHLLQNDFFPNRNSIDLVRRTDKQQEKLIERWNDEKKTPKETLLPRAAADLAEVNTAKSVLDELDRAIHLRGAADSTIQRLQEALPEARRNVHALVDSVLMRELRRSIDSLRSPEFYPPVHMVTISHLSYNGMTGHAPALDDGKWPASLIARKVYDIRVSDDPTYQKQWVGLFFSVPGVNRFGKEMIRGLTAPRNGRRILVDLKHSDLMTRRFFYDSVMVKGTIPPICSHCACTGMDMDLWSAFNDEYSILRAPFVRTFYPFGLNLFNEEIVTIHRNDGIIGLPLEQRVLGGYINKKLPWKFWVDRKGHHEENVQKRMKRWDHSRALFRYLDSDTKGRILLKPAMDYTEKEMGVTGHKDQLEITTEDFISAAPFIQNLIWILDRIKDDTDDDGQVANDSLRHAWRHVCLGSDLDGLIDPIDIVPTAGQYPHFRERLKQFIPIFLELRMLEKPDFIGKDEPVYRGYNDYFDTGFTIDDAMDQLFYNSLHDFTAKYFRKR